MKKSSLFEKLSAEYQAEMQAEENNRLEAIASQREREAVDNEWNAREAIVKERNKHSKGRTINGKVPKRSSSKASRYEAVRFSVPTVKDALIKLFTVTDYASGEAASVIRAMGYNLAGDTASAQKAFNSQNKYNRGKSMQRWAREELRCIGIVDRQDLIDAMTVGLLEK